jgi:hypothetical protein
MLTLQSIHLRINFLVFKKLMVENYLGREIERRDVETCLRAVGTKLYHAGIRSRVSQSTLAEANERRP